MQGAKRCGPGGWGRVEIPVAPAGKHPQAWGAHTRGTWVWKNPRRGASFLQRGGSRVPALEELRVGVPARRFSPVPIGQARGGDRT